jgi:AraC family transcriptional regulator
MLSDKPSMVQTLQEFISFYPRQSLLTSLTTRWQTISLAYMSQPAHEPVGVCKAFHRIAIYTAPWITKYRLGITSKHGVINPGDIVIIPANFSHSVRWIDELERIGIGLDTSLFAYAIDDATNFNPTELLPQFPISDPLVYQLGLSLKSVLEQDPMGSRLYAETTAAMLAVHLLQHYGKQKLELKDYTDGLARSTLRQVIDYIQENLDRELGLAELAAIAHLSPYYFTRLFKRSTGQTPHQFVIRCRVERAKALLLHGQDSIAEIAQQVGFANQAHLNVHIKRSLGVTPKMILEQRKNR